MASSPDADESSEDEIFFGPITLKEVKAILLPKHRRRAMKKANKKKEVDKNDGIKIIEMHSEPEMYNESDITNYLSPLLQKNLQPTASNKLTRCSTIDNSYLKLPPDDSFLLMEKQVAELCMAENRSNDLDNYDFLSNSSVIKLNSMKSNLHIDTPRYKQSAFNSPKIHIEDDVLTHADKNPTKEEENEVKLDSEDKRIENFGTFKTLTLDPAINENNANNIGISKTPTSRNKQAHSVKTPLSKICYEHIASPVAEYIKNPPVIILRGDKTEKQKKLKNIMSNKENMVPKQQMINSYGTPSVPPSEKQYYGVETRHISKSTTKIPLKTHGVRTLTQKILS